MRVDYFFNEKSRDIRLVWEHGVSGPNAGETMFKGYGAGVLFEGTKGQLVADYGKYMLLPEAFAKDFKAPPQTIKPSIGHHKEWTEACKGNGTPLCNFDYAGRLAEAVLLGNMAYRSKEVVTWDTEKGTTGNKKADALLSREFRKGWELPK
jgi:hypothetical protein